MSTWGNSGWKTRDDDEERTNGGDHLTSCSRNGGDGWSWNSWTTHNMDHCHQCRWEKNNSGFGGGEKVFKLALTGLAVGALYSASKNSEKLGIWEKRRK